MLLLNPKIIKMGHKLFDDATKYGERSQKDTYGDEPMSDEDRYDLGDPISWALALGSSTSDATGDGIGGEDTLEGITGVNSLLDIIDGIPWTNIDGNSVATTDPEMFPKYNIYFSEYQYDVTWKDILAFRQHFALMSEFQKIVKGVQTETARALQQFRIPTRIGKRNISR